MSFYSLATASRLSSRSSCRRSRSARHKPARPHLTQFHKRVVTELLRQQARNDQRSSQLRCPACGDRFVQLEVDGVPLDYCQHCRSLWFDSTELMHFTQVFEDVSDGDFVDRTLTLRCPVCRMLMHQRQLSLYSNLMVYACPQQHGLLLEDGDFERALEASNHVDDMAGHLNDQHLAVWRQLQACLSAGEFSASDIVCSECGQNTVTVSAEGIQIDYCTQCQSCWFDTRELQHFTQQTRDVPGDNLRSRDTTHVCPKCRQNMRLYQFHPKSNVMVEACPEGHGVCLRSGQFPQVLKASE